MSEKNKRTKVQLTLHASKLKNVAGLGRGVSDPFAVVTLLAMDSNDQPVVLGRTEAVKNSLNPQWGKTFFLDYEFGKPTHINVGIYDENRKRTDTPMGSAMFELGDVLGCRGNTKGKRLKFGGTVFAHIERASSTPLGVLTLALRGEKLKNVEGFFQGKSDPFFQLSRRLDGPGGSTWRCVFRSQPIKNNLNPKWEPVTVNLDVLAPLEHSDSDPAAALNRPVLVSVFDHEKKGNHTPMGAFETTVQKLITAKEQSTAFFLRRKGKNYGNIYVDNATIRGSSSNNLSSPSSPLYAANTGMSVASMPAIIPPPSPTAPSKPTPTTTPFQPSAPPPPAYNTPTPATYNIPTPNNYPSTTAPLPNAPVYVLPPPLAPPSAPVTPVAVPRPPPPSTQKRPTFLDYISGSCELQMCVAIDFTGSNGDPRIPNTLHYIHRDQTGHTLNDYEKAISAVGGIVAKYDSDQKFPVWGFGAKYDGVVRHCFQVGPAPEANRISGVLQSYRSVFQTSLTMSGPTVVTEVIQFAAAKATEAQNKAQRNGRQAYTVLLILTDGAVTDVNATKNAISAASGAPLSIVIVGIGRADFRAMQFLDDFDTQRDIVQFVEFEAYRHDRVGLTQKTLEEIPDQLVNYFYSRGIMPLPPPNKSSLNIVEDGYNEDTDIDLSIDINPNDENDIVLNNPRGAYVDSNYRPPSMYGNFTTASSPTAPGHNGNHNAPPPPPPPPSYNTPSPPMPAPHGSRLLQVQVPHGVQPGMQLQVQNPQTGQAMMVTVPNGVAPGSLLSVAY